MGQFDGFGVSGDCAKLLAALLRQAVTGSNIVHVSPQMVTGKPLVHLDEWFRGDQQGFLVGD